MSSTRRTKTVRRQPRVAMLALGLPALLLGGWWSFHERAPAEPSTTRPETPARAEKQARAGGPLVLPQSASVRPHSEPAVRTVKAELETAVPAAPESLPADSVHRGELLDPARYLEKYEGKTVPLSPWLRPEPPFKRSPQSSEQGDPQLSAWVNPAHVEVGERFDIEAQLTDASGKSVPASIEVRVRPRTRRDLELQASAQPATREGHALYGAAFEAIESWRVLADTEADAPLPMEFMVSARSTSGGSGSTFERSVSGLFFVHEPGAAFIADSARIEKQREARDRNLTLSVKAAVTRSGRYWAGAELWAGERPIALAQLRLGTLEPGTHSIVLLFGGQVIRDRAVDGPYTVRNVRLRRIDTTPPHEAPAIAVAGQTPPYRYTEFQ